MSRRIVLCLPGGAPRMDPRPDETAKRDVDVAFEWDGSPAGVVGWAEGGVAALELAARHGDFVDRLVLVSTPPLESVGGATAVDPVHAKTLLVYGTREGGSAEAKWWQKRLGGRIEMVPDGGRDILERVWPRVLSHLAPGTLGK